MAQSKTEKLNKEIENCRKCPLWKGAQNAVPGEGPIGAKIMFIGEAPGREEDLTGRPFIGRAGKFLTKLLTENGIKREEVFITSVVKHRPPKNRQPKTKELQSCEFWWRKQIEIIKPRIIVILGRFAFNAVAGSKESLSESRGKFLVLKKDWGMQNFFVTFHPSAGLRFVKFKKIIEKDFKKLKKGLKSF